MDQVKRIIEDVKVEKKRTDKIFQDVTFEVRAEQVIMFFNYNEIIDNVNGNQIYVKIPLAIWNHQIVNGIF